MSERTDALRQALELTPDNHVLRRMLAEALVADGDPAGATAVFRALLDADSLPDDALLGAADAALDAGAPGLVVRLLDRADRAGIVEGVAARRAQAERALERAGVVRLAAVGGGRDDDEGGESPFDFDEETLDFTAVGGLDDVKKIIHRMIILPTKRPDLYAKYGRKAGGGVLMYGPPGCGKTLLARATAGECGLPFLNVRIEQILDPWLGMSERNLHDAFERARSRAPCVLFVDELDAIGYARRHQKGNAARSLVDQLLQELDAIGSENEGLLVLAATNAPWDLDEALRRPGRFDRSLFVPPPDRAGRIRILEIHLGDRPARGIDGKALAVDSPLFSGADLQAWVEQATDRVIDEALASNTEPPLRMEHFREARVDLTPSTHEWLARAARYVEFANQSRQYDDVARFLRSKEVRRHGKLN